MNDLYNELTLHYQRLPHRWRIMVTAFVFIFMCSQALSLGESVGKALYYLTH